MEAPRGKLRGAFVFLLLACAASAWAGPPLKKGDHGLLGEATALVPEPRPSNEPEVSLPAAKAVKILEVKDGRVLVEANGGKGWVPSSAIRYERMASVRGSGLVVMPEQLKAFGKTYASRKICANHLFTESASFYYTGDPKLPIAVLCTGELDGEPNTLSLLGPKEALRSKSIDPKESSSTIDDATLIKAIDSLIRAESK